MNDKPSMDPKAKALVIIFVLLIVGWIAASSIILDERKAK